MTPRCLREAARRHYQDAQFLEQAQPPRWANADHHYGFAAECVVKALILVAHQRAQHTWKEPERVHINNSALWFELDQAISARRELQTLVQGLPRQSFKTWDVKQRYHCDGSACFSPQEVQRHRDAALRFLKTLEGAERAGVFE